MKKAFNKRALAMLLMALTVSPMLIACSSGDSGNAADTTTAAATAETTPGETTSGRIEHELPDMTFGGRDFIILGRKEETNTQFNNFDIEAAEMTGEIVNDAVFKRNSDINEKYDITVKGIYASDTVAEMQKYVNAGDDVPQVSFHTLGTIGAPAAGGYFTDLYTLDYIDYDKPWWHQEKVNDAVSIAGRLWFTTSAFNMGDKNRTYLMSVNKDMVDEFDLEAPYDLINEDRWVIEKMTEMEKVVAADVDGDGEMTDVDRYGFAGDSVVAFYVMVAAQDNWIVNKDADDMPEIVMNNERMVASIDKALTAIRDPNYSMVCDDFRGKVDYSHWSVGSRITNDNNNALFATTFTHGLKDKSAKCDHDYGIVPYPKFDESQEEYVSIPDPVGAQMFAVPKSVNDLETAGFMLELLSSMSYYDVLPVYIETSAKTKYMYDEQSAEMFDLIFDTLRYDLGVMYNWGGLYTLIRSNIPTARQNTFASLYASKEEAAQTAMEETIDKFLEY